MLLAILTWLLRPLLYLWSVVLNFFRGKQPTQLVGHRGTIRAIAVSNDGSMAASASGDHTVRVWDIATGKCIGVCGSIPEKLIEGGCGTGHGHVVTCVCFSPDSRWVASVSYDKNLRVWSPDGTPLAILQGHVQVLHCCAWAPSGQSIASAGSDRTIKVWRLRQAGQDDMQNLCWGGGKVLEFAFADVKAVLLEDTHEDTDVFRQITLRHRTAVPGVSCSVTSLRGHSSTITSIAFSPDGSRILSTDHDGNAMLFDPHWVPSALHSSDEDKAGWVGGIHLSGSQALSCAWSHCGGLFAVGTQAGICFVCSARNLSVVQELRLGSGYVSAVAFSTHEDGAVSVLCADAQRRVRVWDPTTGALRGSVGVGTRVYALAVPKRGSHIVVGCGDFSVCVVGDRGLLGRGEGVAKLKDKKA